MGGIKATVSPFRKGKILPMGTYSSLTANIIHFSSRIRSDKRGYLSDRYFLYMEQNFNVMNIKEKSMRPHTLFS